MEKKEIEKQEGILDKKISRGKFLTLIGGALALPTITHFVSATNYFFKDGSGNDIVLIPESDGFKINGGTTSRTFNLNSGNIEIQGAGSATITFPSSTSTLASLDLSETLQNKTLTSPVINTSVSGTAILDEDDFASNSDTKLATQQSIKAYIDNVATPKRVYMSSDQSWTSDTTLSNVTGMSFSVVSGVTYKMSGVLYLYSTSSTPDLQIDFTAPTSSYQRISWNNPSAGDEEVLTAFSTTSARIDISANTRSVVYINIFFTPTASGTLQLRASQATSNAVASTIEKGSNLVLEVLL